MNKQQQEPRNTSEQCCPNETCVARGKRGEGTLTMQDRQRQRSRCRSGGRTCRARRGTMVEGRRTPTELMIIVVTLLASGCPLQAMVHAYELDERTVASWRDRAGKPCQQVHHALIEQGTLDLVHVQADESRVKGRSLIAWMGVSMMVSTRLWLGGVVSRTRDTARADRMMQQVRACSHVACALLVCTDGWAASPNRIKRAFRDNVKETAGRGRACLRVWPQWCIATVMKRTQKKRVGEVTRTMTLGVLEQANRLLHASQGGTALTTALIERVNGTMRERLAAVTRTCRPAARRLEALSRGMSLIGCTDHVCWPHHELRKATQRGFAWTPAMASGLTNPIWSVEDV